MQPLISIWNVTLALHFQAQGKSLQCSECIISFFCPEAFVKTGMHGTSLTEESVPCKRSPGEVPQGGWGSNLSCWEKIWRGKNKKLKARQKGVAITDFQRHVKYMSATIRKVDQRGKTYLLLSSLPWLVLILILSSDRKRSWFQLQTGNQFQALCLVRGELGTLHNQKQPQLCWGLHDCWHYSW